MATRREFLKKSGVAALGAASASHLAHSAVGDQQPAISTAGSAGDSAKLLRKRLEHPSASTADRLPLEWHQERVKQLQQKLRDRGLDGILISDHWNIIYFTGLWHTTTERPFSCFIPTDDLAVHWFHPGLDYALVRSWWFTDGDYYFDYPPSKEGYPDQGKVSISEPVDLIEFQLTGISKRGYGGKKIGLSQSPTVGVAQRMRETLPDATFEDVSDICMRMRRVKTPEEIALSQRAYNYFSQIHAWTRDYILQHGTDLTDFKIGMTATEYATDLIMRDIKRDGHPHSAVGIRIGIGCRAGIGTAYPHPNQFHYNKVKKGDSLQVSGVVKLAGCGGELYCPYHVGAWPADWEKVWEVMARSAEMQIELSKVGTPCQNVARAVHEYQVKEGMQNVLYQRVAHGEGWEGHQEPYISLGDTTPLEKNMTFSMEPGLFNPEKGFGYNPSDNVVVGDEKGWVQGSVPNLTKEWAHLKL